MPHVTLQDVADRAGVHRSTVALALRDHPRIPADTRELIRALAEKLGYRKNPLVAALMRSRR
jgi:LacI family transcriptional regulator